MERAWWGGRARGAPARDTKRRALGCRLCRPASTDGHCRGARSCARAAAARATPPAAYGRAAAPAAHSRSRPAARAALGARRARLTMSPAAPPDVASLTELHAIQALLADTIAAERALDAELEGLLAQRAVRRGAARAALPAGRDCCTAAQRRPAAAARPALGWRLRLRRRRGHSCSAGAAPGPAKRTPPLARKPCVLTDAPPRPCAA
jgi:hypothetical protein